MILNNAILVADNKLIVSVPRDDNSGFTNSGAVHIFDFDSGLLLHTIENPTPANNETFGSNTFIQDDYLIISVPYKTVNAAPSSGSVYIYDLDSAALLHTIENPAGGANEYFGYGNVIGDTLFITNSSDTLGGNLSVGATYSFLYDFNGDGRVDGTVQNDIIYGSAAQNLLTGGAGADTFVFQTTTAFIAADIITDFNATEGDILDIRDLLSGYDSLNDDIADFVRFSSDYIF